jgi:hypothetical protein
MFYKWHRTVEVVRRRVWRLYGWFAALMASGSCVGLLTWSAWMQSLSNNLIGSDAPDYSALSSRLFSVANSWSAAYLVAYPVELLCLTTALLMMLDRMMDFASSRADSATGRWVFARRAVAAVVTALNAVGVAGNVASAVMRSRAAALYQEASAMYTANNSASGHVHKDEAKAEVERAVSVSSVQSCCEAAALLLLLLAFAVVGVACARRVSVTLLATQPTAVAAATGRMLWRRIVTTTVFVFAALLLRSLQSTMHAAPFPAKTPSLELSCAANLTLAQVRRRLFAAEQQPRLQERPGAVRPRVLQQLHAHGALDEPHARVPAPCRRHIVTRRAAGGAVGHDSQPYAASHAARIRGQRPAPDAGNVARGICSQPSLAAWGAQPGVFAGFTGVFAAETASARAGAHQMSRPPR